MKNIRKHNRIAVFAAVGVLLLTLFVLSFLYFQEQVIHAVLGPPKATPTIPEKATREMPQAEQDELKKDIAEAGWNFESAAAQKIAQTAAETEQRTSEDNQKELEKRGRQLRKYVSEESVDAMVEPFQKWAGTTPRAETPEFLPPEGPLDVDTAQIHDVRREKQDDGTYRYTLVLLDAAGRQETVEMPASEAEPIWNVFQTMKKNPLMEKIYRSMVIPLLDKALQQK